MPPEAIMVRSSKLRSMTGSISGCPHFLHSWVAKGAKSPEMNVLALQRPHATIFNGLPAPVASLLTIPLYHRSSPRQVSSLPDLRRFTRPTLACVPKRFDLDGKSLAMRYAACG